MIRKIHSLTCWSSAQAVSLRLSSSLLRAILMNHMAHSEAIKAARDTESHLKGEVEQLRASIEKKDNEMRRYVHCLLNFLNDSY